MRFSTKVPQRTPGRHFRDVPAASLLALSLRATATKYCTHWSDAATGQGLTSAAVQGRAVRRAAADTPFGTASLTARSLSIAQSVAPRRRTDMCASSIDMCGEG